MVVQHMKKLLCRILAFGVIGIMITTNVYASDFSYKKESSEITQYMDCFMPMPIIDNLSDDCWGAAEVGPRDQDNGLEDQTMSDYCYWDGSIIKDEQSGKYYMFASRWAQNGGHWGSSYDGNLGWRGSKAIRAVSDNLYGPYIDEGPLWDDYYDGVGHNVFAFKLSEKDPLYDEYKYAIVVSDVGRHSDYVNGTIHLSDSLTGSWEHIGKMNVDSNLFSLSNISIIVRPDGKYEAINRHGYIAIAESIEGPWEVVNQKLWWKVPGMPTTTLINVEDPVLWYSDGLYHCIANKWDTRYAYYFTSEDGIHNWKLHPGTAYTPTENFLSYTDGTQNNWTKLERPNVYIENGTITAMTFAVIDVQKEQDMPNDSHGSKVIVVPFAGNKLTEFASRKDELDDREGICPIEDSNTQSWHDEIDKNYGAEPFMQLQGNNSNGLFGECERTDESYDCKIGYLKYDLSSFNLPNDINDIYNAHISLVYMDKKAGSDSQDRIQICLTDSDWSEGDGWSETNNNLADNNALTWWNQPSLYYDENNIKDTTAVSEEFSLDYTNSEVTIDVTGLLKQFLKNNPNENIISFALSETKGGNLIKIGSREAGERYAAKLMVYTKQPVVNTPTPTITPCPATASPTPVSPVTASPAIRTFNVGSIQYRITKSKTVSVTKLLKKNQTTVKIPEKVTYKGVKYNVSSIDKKVFFNNKKIRKVVIGRNITTIGAGNFLNCTNLKSITFKGTRAPKIGTRSFLKVNKKCKITISKKMKGKQLKLLKTRIKKANLPIN
jgi:carbohydrate binding family 6